MTTADEHTLPVAGALSLLALSVGLLILISPLVVGLGLGGLALAQILCFLLPSVLVTRAMTGSARRGLALVPVGFRQLTGAFLVGSTFWVISVVFLLPIVIALFGEARLESTAEELRFQGPVALQLFAVAIVPSVAEELLHRGVVARALNRSMGMTAAVVISGIIFGLFHLSLVRFLPTAALGALLAFAALRTGSLYPAIIIHFLNNAASLLAHRYLGDRNIVYALPVALVASLGGIYLLAAPPEKSS